MGNSSSNMIDAELRTLVHQVGAYLNSKSTILYQISLLKLKLNTGSKYSDLLSESKGIEKELAAMPNLISTLKEIAIEKMNAKAPEDEAGLDLVGIFEQKDKEIEELEMKYGESEMVIDKLISLRDEMKRKLDNVTKNKEDGVKMGLNEIKERCAEIVAESENLNALIVDLKEKLEFLQKKKAEVMIRRGNKRKSVLGMSIINKSAMDLKSKYILKQELIKTIQQTKAEQDAQMANFEMRNKMINMRYENMEDEEMNLNAEINQNKDKIIELEWEIEKLVKEKKQLNYRTADLSINLGDRMQSPDDGEGSLGSSLGSLLNGFGDYKLEKEAIAEENLKLKRHIQDIISVRKN